jgi:hypothetical protein
MVIQFKKIGLNFFGRRGEQTSTFLTVQAIKIVIDTVVRYNLQAVNKK